MNEKKNTHGGKREGAGRKKSVAKKYTFGAVKEVSDFLDNYEGNKNDLFNRAILAYAKQQK